MLVQLQRIHCFKLWYASYNQPDSWKGMCCFKYCVYNYVRTQMMQTRCLNLSALLDPLWQIHDRSIHVIPLTQTHIRTNIKTENHSHHFYFFRNFRLLPNALVKNYNWNPHTHFKLFFKMTINKNRTILSPYNDRMLVKLTRVILHL